MLCFLVNVIILSNLFPLDNLCLVYQFDKSRSLAQLFSCDTICVWYISSTNLVPWLNFFPATQFVFGISVRQISFPGSTFFLRHNLCLVYQFDKSRSLAQLFSCDTICVWYISSTNLVPWLNFFPATQFVFGISVRQISFDPWLNFFPATQFVFGISVRQISFPGSTFFLRLETHVS